MPIRLSGINSGLDTDALVKELVSAYSLKTEKYQKEQTKIEWKQDAWKSLNTKIYGLYTNISNLRFSSAYNLKRTSVSDATKASVTASSDAVAGTQKLNILQTAQASYMTGARLGEDVTKATQLKDLGITEDTTITVKTKDGKEKEIEIKSDMAIGDLMQKFSDAGLNANFDENNQRFFISAKETGAAADFDIVASDDAGYQVLSKLGIASKEDAAESIKRQAAEYNKLYAEYATLKDSGATDDETTQKIADLLEQLNTYSADIKKVAAGQETAENIAAKDENLATKIEGQDAIIKLNDVTYTNSSNSFSINGLTIDAHGVTGDGDKNAISISTSVDTQGIYDKIKDFLTEYNSVINEITKLYNAESAGEYQPLSDEEKEAMSEEQIEKWESKIKDSLLRRDNSLGTIMTAMVNSMSQGIEVNGEKLTLSSFGIQTLGFLNAADNEQYAYHIDGDPDDENSSGKKDKLMTAIQEDPDKIMSFMQKLATNLYTAIDTKMKSTELSSAYKVYNDKELDSQLNKYKDLIKKWEEKVAAEEDRYFKQFSNMEVALSKLQSQTNALSGLLGQ